MAASFFKDTYCATTLTLNKAQQWDGGSQCTTRLMIHVQLTTTTIGKQMISAFLADLEWKL